MLDVLRFDPKTQTYVKEKKPKLVPACQQPAAEGMVIRADTSEYVLKARAAVQEFLLLNHPVDCPICDQAGECRLQDYWLEHQTTNKRMRDEPVHKPKAVVFGPTIVYDAERCISCTCCIRVCDEVAKDPVLTLRQRGNLNEIALAPGRKLDHPYSLMTEYLWERSRRATSASRRGYGSCAAWRACVPDARQAATRTLTSIRATRRCTASGRDRTTP
jgi:NADH-quinone oxidoreductase subunit G